MELVEVKVFSDGVYILPRYETEFAAGMDLKVDFSKIKDSMDFMGDGETFIYNSETKSVILEGHGGRILLPTNLYVAIPDGYEIQIRPRSGLALKHGITVLNSPGTIDSDYRGQIGLIIINTSNKSFEIKDGERMGQAVLNKVEQIEWNVVRSIDELGETVRGAGGFGHTNK